MDITQLRTLVCVSELGSLSKAADQLCTAQPALSRQMRILEEELGARLFDRNGRGMSLTEQGRVVLQHAARILSEFEHIKSSVAEESGAMSGGHVSIGMPPSVSEVLAVPLVKAVRKSRPNATCRIVSAYSLYLLEWLHRGSLDLAILYDPASIRSLRSAPLLEESFYVVAPPDSGLSPGEPLAFRSLVGKPLLLPSPDHSLRQIVAQAAEECGVTLDVKVEVDSYTALRSLVLGGCGWTILPLAPVLSDLASGRLCAAPLADPAPRRVLELSLPTDRPASRLTSFVQEAVVSTAAGLVAAGAWPAKMRTRS